MGSAETLAGYAGGGAVTTAVAKVKDADAAAITTAASKLSMAATNVSSYSGEVAGSVTTLDAAWEGASADGFVAYMNKFKSAGTDIGTAMSNAATALTNVATAITGAKTYISTRCDQALTDIRTWSDSHPHATTAEFDAMTRGVCSGVAGDINTHLEGTEQTLSAALRTLNTSKSPAAKFSTLPQPNTQPFTPQSGQPIEWTETPEPATTPSNATNNQQPAHHANANSSHGGSSSGGGGGGGGGGGLGPSGGPPAGGPPPGNVQEWIKQAIEILRQNGINVSEADAQRIWQIIQHESGGNPQAINNWDCVPLHTMIMTNRGWLKHDEVQVGDRTIGYNPATGGSEWTTVTRVVHHADAPLVRISNSRWSATTTPNHRWLNVPRVAVRQDDLPQVCSECGWLPRSSEQAKNAVAVHRRKIHGVVPRKAATTYVTEPEFVRTDELRSRDRLLLAAPADTEGRLAISTREAAILGWIAGDGHVEKRRHRPTMSIAQSKPKMVEKLRRLLDGMPHVVYVDDRGGCGPRHQFRLDHAYSSDLMKRAGHPRTDAVNQVLAMSTEQRNAWLEAITDAEGTRSVRPGYTKPYVTIYQRPGEVLDAAAVAIYLSGARPRVLNVSRSTYHPGWSPEATVRGNTAVVTGAFLHHEDAGRGDVWCVTTELGSWTAREDDHIFLTGNSNAAKGTPSKGLMQCIDPTFNSYKLAGHNDIWNPVDNICAGVNYAISRYGSLANVPGIKATASGGSYVGY